MNSFKFNWAVVLASFLAASLLIWVGAFVVDWVHPRLGCVSAEREWARARTEPMAYSRISSLYWSTLCDAASLPLLISASEGTGAPSFPDVLFAQKQVLAHEITGAHRGLKTIAYLLTNEIHSERVENLRLIGLINPVYFSFAARTDAASIRLSSLSNLSFMARMPVFKQRWDEFLLDSFFIGAKAYLEELQGFGRPPVRSIVRDLGAPTEPVEGEFDLGRNMRVEKVENFKTFTSPFHDRVEPSRYMFDRVVEFARAHPGARVCFVMLPTNTRNFRHFGRDAEVLTAQMSALMAQLPEEMRLDLQDMNEDSFLFLDPMHLTEFGKWKVMERILASPCGQRVLAP